MRRTAAGADDGVIADWAELVLPWLSAVDLASAAAVCHPLRRAVTAITTRRAADAARGMEPNAIPFSNSTGDSKPYAYFLYSPTLVLSSVHPVESQPWGGLRPFAPSSTPSLAIVGADGLGCDCSDRCSSPACGCASPASDEGLWEGAGEMRECGGSCRCPPECGNRETQGGIRVRLGVVRDARKGWSLHAMEFISAGQFVCEYAGELLTTREARRRQSSYDRLASTGKFSPALLVLREHLPSGKACLRFNIDATTVGNVARFINHACDGGNLQPIFVRTAGSVFPRVCFFASVDIAPGKELAFSYGSSSAMDDGLPCFCGSSCCLGVLPSEVI